MRGGYDPEDKLWPILIAWFGKNKPLLPNLQQLILHSERNFPVPYQHLPLMVPPSLRSITLINMGRLHATIFYQLLLFRGCSPTKVEHIDNGLLPHNLAFFENLCTLVVSGSGAQGRYDSPNVSLLELLQQLPSLKWLEIKLGVLKIETDESLDPIDHLTLETLILDGTTEELEPFLLFDISCPSVKRISLKLRFKTDLAWNHLFEAVTAMSPRVNDISLRVPKSTGAPKLIVSDLGSLLLSHEVESFVMEDVPNELSWTDLRRMFGAWPQLRALTLTGGGVPFSAAALLFASGGQNLRALHLPIDFTPLASPDVVPFLALKSPVRYLRVAAPMRFPLRLKERAMLALNLVILLPNIETVHFADVEGTTDLRDLFEGVRDVTTAHERRGFVFGWAAE